MSIHLIRTVARYEMRTLLRSWFFRIFAAMVTGGLAIFNVALNVVSSGSPWFYRALPASIPYANLIILNLGQAIVAVFLASEFLKQDRKNDSVEVIYARCMSNGTYILGKTLGILAVFLVLNIIVLLIGIGFSFMSNVSTQHIFTYFTYPLLISVPTLVFILGLSFFVMTLIKNQAVTFILVAGYIALTVFYLNKKAFHIFDYIAYQVPMMYSSISGFGDFTEILLHRLLYFFLGIGLIYLTVYGLSRLPQTKRPAMSLILGIFFIALGGLFAGFYLNIKMQARTFKRQAVVLNNRYANFPRVTVTRCTLHVDHLGNTIAAEAQLMVVNKNPHACDTLIFSLNPGLDLRSVTINNQPALFERESQIIQVLTDASLQSGDSARIDMFYSGTINENICFLDQDQDNANDNFNMEVFTLRKRYAFLQKEYVCFTAESLWYPIAGTGYATDRPLFSDPDFVKFNLTVKTSPSLTAISQGAVSHPDEGVFQFKPEYALPQISLLIGKYTVSAIQVDSVAYQLYNIKGHDYYSDLLDQVSDTLATVIHNLRQEFEVKTGLTYPFRRFMLVEVPVHFAVDKHTYSFTSDAVQPEMILCPEKGVMFDVADFKQRKYRLEKDLKNSNEELMPAEVQAMLLTQFLRNNFMAAQQQYYAAGEIVDYNTFSVFPLFYNFVTRLQSPQWPVLSLAFEVYVRERKNESGTVFQVQDDIGKNEKINLELSRASLGMLLRSGIEANEDDDNDPLVISDIVVAKGNQLFSLFKTRLGGKIDTLVLQLIRTHAHGIIPYENFESELQASQGIDLDDQIEGWYNQRSLPGFIIRQVTSYKVMDGENTRYQIRFAVTNPESTDGIITLHVELNDPNRANDNPWENNFNADFSKTIFVAAGSSREIGFISNTEPARMSIATHISKNLPANLIFSFTGFGETRRTAPFDGVTDIPFIPEKDDPGEIVVDNEDKDFAIYQGSNQAYLKSLVTSHQQQPYKYKSIWSWNPPRNWNAVLRSEFNGDYIHSAYYTRSGSGERTATWKTHLPQKARYDVYFYLSKPDIGWRRTNKQTMYNFIVHHDDGVDKVNRGSEEAEPGWVLIGNYSFSSDTAMVELTNNSSGEMVFADAVKWVLTK